MDDLILLASKMVDTATDYFIPFRLVMRLELVSYLFKLQLKLLDSSIYVALFGLCHCSELVNFLNDFRVVPQLRRPYHFGFLICVVLCFEGIHACHCLLQSADVGSLPVWQHSLLNEVVLNILLNCLVNVFKPLSAVLQDHFVLLVQEALPNIITTEFSNLLHLEPASGLLSFVLFDILKVFGAGCVFLERLGCYAHLRNQLRLLLKRRESLLFLGLKSFSVSYVSHPLSRLEGCQKGDRLVHAASIVQLQELS